MNEGYWNHIATAKISLSLVAGSSALAGCSWKRGLEALAGQILEAAVRTLGSSPAVEVGSSLVAVVASLPVVGPILLAARPILAVEAVAGPSLAEGVVVPNLAAGAADPTLAAEVAIDPNLAVGVAAPILDFDFLEIPNSYSI